MKRTEKQNQKSKFRIPFSAVLMYLAVVVVALSGVTFSKYVISTSAGDNARVAKIKGLTVTETGNYASDGKWIITPGVDIEKQATVNFEGSEMACYVFCEVKTEGWTRSDATSDNHSYSYSDGTLSGLDWKVDNSWTYLDGTKDSTKNKDDVVYWKLVETNTPLNDVILADDGKISVSENLTRSQLDTMTKNLSIEFNVTAVQYGGFADEKAAWAAVKGK